MSSGTILTDVVAGFSPAQITKALDLIAKNYIRPTEFAGEYLVISSGGNRRYHATRDACECAGAMRQHGLAKCKHQCGVRLLEAGRELEGGNPG